MVGSGAADRSKEAVGMMALHEALRNVCLNSDWTYSVFWTIRPRPYVLFFGSLKSSTFLFLFSLFLYLYGYHLLKLLSFLFKFCVFQLFCLIGILCFGVGEWGVVMVARLEMTTAACKYAWLFFGLFCLFAWFLEKQRKMREKSGLSVLNF